FEDIASVLAKIVMMLETDSVDERLRSRESNIRMFRQQARKLRRQGERAFNAALLSIIIQVVVLFVCAVAAVKSIQSAAKQFEAAQDYGNTSKEVSVHQDQAKNCGPDQKVNEDTQKLQIEAKTQSMNEKKMWFDYFSQQGTLQKTGMDIAMQLGQAMTSFINADSQRDVKHLEGEEVRRSSRASYYSTEADVERS